jgi:hypothetical protein
MGGPNPSPIRGTTHPGSHQCSPRWQLVAHGDHLIDDGFHNCVIAISAIQLHAKFSRPAVHQCRLLAGTAASERLLISSMRLNGKFQALRLAVRPAWSDPQRSAASSEEVVDLDADIQMFIKMLARIGNLQQMR